MCQVRHSSPAHPSGGQLMAHAVPSSRLHSMPSRRNASKTNHSLRGRVGLAASRRVLLTLAAATLLLGCSGPDISGADGGTASKSDLTACERDRLAAALGLIDGAEPSLPLDPADEPLADIARDICALDGGASGPAAAPDTGVRTPAQERDAALPAALVRAPALFDPSDAPPGIDEALDNLWVACGQGSAAACNALLYESSAGSDYEAFAFSCGGRENLHCNVAARRTRRRRRLAGRRIRTHLAAPGEHPRTGRLVGGVRGGKQPRVCAARAVRTGGIGICQLRLDLRRSHHPRLCAARRRRRRSACASRAIAARPAARRRRVPGSAVGALRRRRCDGMPRLGHLRTARKRLRALRPVMRLAGGPRLRPTVRRALRRLSPGPERPVSEASLSGKHRAKPWPEWPVSPIA